MFIFFLQVIYLFSDLSFSWTHFLCLKHNLAFKKELNQKVVLCSKASQPPFCHHLTPHPYADPLHSAAQTLKISRPYSRSQISRLFTHCFCHLIRPPELLIITKNLCFTIAIFGELSMGSGCSNLRPVWVFK